MLTDYFWPPEWSRQKSIFLAYPHSKAIWEELHDQVCNQFEDFILKLSQTVIVNLLVENSKVCSSLFAILEKKSIRFGRARLENINLIPIKTDDIWIRDYGPLWIQKSKQSFILDFRFNAWGEKFFPYSQDDQAAYEIARHHNILTQYLREDFVLEGGSLETNGNVLFANADCIYRPERRLSLSIQELEKKLCHYLGVKHIVWLDYCLPGDDTDGHIDLFIRFTSKNTVAYNFPEKNHLARAQMQKLKNEIHKILPDYVENLQLIEIPMPKTKYKANTPLASSYMNFLITNDCVFVPVYNDANDKEAIDIFEQLFRDREVEGIFAGDFITQGGALHCMTMPEFVSC